MRILMIQHTATRRSKARLLARFPLKKPDFRRRATMGRFRLFTLFIGLRRVRADFLARPRNRWQSKLSIIQIDRLLSAIISRLLGK